MSLIERIVTSKLFWPAAALIIPFIITFHQSTITLKALDRLEEKRANIEIMKTQYNDKINFLINVSSNHEAIVARAYIANDNNSYQDFINEFCNSSALATKAEIYFPDKDIHKSIMNIFLYVMLNTQMGSRVLSEAHSAPEVGKHIEEIRAISKDMQKDFLLSHQLNLANGTVEMAKRMLNEMLVK
jgi:hypothetical protein